MLVGEHLPVDTTEERSSWTEGSASVTSTREIPSARDPVSGGNTFPADFISTQPLPAAAPLLEVSQGEEVSEKAQCDQPKPTCPRCGLTVPDDSEPPPSPGLGLQQSPGLSVHSSKSSSSSSKRSKTTRNVVATHQTAASPAAADSCLRLLLACLWCQGSMFLLALLEAGSSCLHSLCTSCCHACTRCCAAAQEVPGDELTCNVHCQSVLLDSCCESVECLEFCLECCEICHRS